MVFRAECFFCFHIKIDHLSLDAQVKWVWALAHISHDGCPYTFQG